ncbi:MULTISPECIES: division plane positioning ATPase MipZ [unclassified Hyphomonas]|jgi:chromosome partitioning protein|uniref:division plane positioning ATPase MipZ n=1 Tax=unclassified Hyphomonas TaxID=2630699 RepID=UPI000AD87707|nr:division plane positioning ATPase MipZ [Hyphomonas sp. BRH_c22]
MPADGFAPVSQVGGPDMSVQQRDARVIVIGNEKGGAGKSTVSMHLSVALMRMGKKVGIIDLDVRQRTLTRYLENRLRWMTSTGAKLPMPEIIRVDASTERDLDKAEAEETQRFLSSLARLKKACDFVLVDAPGGDTFLSRLAHVSADSLITPLNDSFVDFDLLGDVNPQTLEVIRPSFYSEMVWSCRKKKAQASRRPIDWIVMRNRMSPLAAKNKERVGEALENLSKRIGFRLAPGLSERVIYRELFPAGLTLLDLTEKGSNVSFTMSHVAARQEMRDLLIVLQLPELIGAEIEF